MKRIYSLFHQYTASVLLVSFFLQSCGGGFGNNPLIPTREEQIASIQTNTQAILPRADIQPLTGQVLTAEGGHAVTFYEEAGELRANVEMNTPQGFSKSYEGVEVLLEKGADLSNLSRLDKKSQERRIELQLAQGGKLAHIVIYKGAALMGGMLEGEEEAEEDEQENASIPNECFCPITQEIMEDPVIAQDGHTYERQAIKCWFDMGKRISPKTGARLLTTELIANYTMRSLIQDIKDQVPVLARHRLDMHNIEVAIKLREEEIEETLAQKGHLVEKESQTRLGLEQELRQKQKELEEKTDQLNIMQERVKALEEQVHSFLEKDKKMHATMLQLQQSMEQLLSAQLISSSSPSSNSSNGNISIPDRNKEERTIGINNIEDDIVLESDVSEKEIEELPISIIYDAPHKEVIKRKLVATQQKTSLYLEHEGLDKNDIVFLINHPLFKNNCKTYQTISLKRNRIGAEGAILVAQHLQGTNVQNLALGGNEIGPEGAIELIKHLQGTSIHTLDLFINGIGPDGAIELAHHLQKTNVHRIELGANGISYRIRQFLQGKYPGINWIF